MENLKQALKRTTAVLMVMVLVIGIAPIGSLADVEWSELALTASAEELVDGDYKYTVENGEATITGYTGDGGDIVIPSALGGHPVTSIGYSAFRYCESLTSIEIPDSVTSIGDYAFSSCYSLISIEIPDGVTSIGDSVFEYCYSLTSIEIPDSVTSIGDSAFRYCESLTSIKIPDSVTSIGDSTFSDCSSLTSIEIPGSVTSIGDYAFSDCESLTSIEIPDSVTSIGYFAFSDCESLTSIEIPDSVTYISNGVFDSCTSLTSIKIPDGVTSIGYFAFSDCESLTSIEIPDSVTSIGDSAFKYCSSLTSIEIPDSVTSIGGSAFLYTAYYNDTDNWEDGVLYIGNHLIIVTDDKSGNYAIKSGTRTIADDAFYDCYRLTSIEIPDSITSIGDGAFEDCSSLTSIEIPDSVTSIGYSAFAWCERLTSIEIPDSVTSIGSSAFFYCTSLTSIEISDSVTSIGHSAFYYTAYYNDTDNWEDGVLYIGNHLIEVTDDKSGNYAIKPGTKTIAGSAFYYCESLTSIEIPDSVTYISNGVFDSCTSLTSIKIPDSVTSIGDDAFENCDNLTDVYYTGSQEDWNNINIRSGNDNLKNAILHCGFVSHTHSYTSSITTPATCTKAGIKTYTCSCGDSYTEEIKATGKHTGGTATCKAKAICSVCKQAYSSFANHKETTLAGKSATYTSTGLTEGKKCSVCNTVTVKQTTIPKLTLVKVTGLKAKKVKVAKSSEITLSWTSLGEGVKYEVYQKNGKKWKKLKTTSSTSYTVKKLKADKEYQFRVRAVVDGVNGSYSKTLKVETIPETTTLKLKAGKKQLTASWKSVSDISGYEVQYSTSKKMKSAKKVSAKKSSKKTTIKKLKKGKKYYVRIRTYKTVNGKKIYSSWSKVKNVKVK